MSEHHHHVAAEQEYGTGQKTLKIYLIGFALCILLTFIPFWMVAQHVIKDQFTMHAALLGLALVQFFVQVVCFLRLNAGPKARWHLASFLFAIVVIFTIVVGSIWIMYSLNYNMAM